MATSSSEELSQAAGEVVLEAGDFASLLQKEFKPKTDKAKEAVENAVRTLAEQALSSTTLISGDVLGTVEALIAQLDLKLSEQINLVLHHPEFQALESAWRGLHHLVNNTETDETLKIRVMNISKAEMHKSLKKYKGTAWDQSPIFKKLYEEEYGQFGGEPFGSLVADYYFDNSGPDVELLAQMAQIAAAAHAPLSVLLLLVLSARITSFVRNEAYVLDLRERVDATVKLAQATPRSASPLVTLPVLNTLRVLPTGYAERDNSVPLLMRFGLYQGRKLSPAAIAAYRRLLLEALLPRLTDRLEGQLRRGDANNFDYLYEALRAYLMLGERKRFNAEALQAWFELDLNNNFPAADELQRQQLSEHLGALIETLQLPETAPVRMDAELIAATRLTLARVPLPRRIYEHMKKEFAQAALADFSVSDAGGPAATLVLMRYSGAPLTRGVPGMYTLAGYRKFLEAIDQVIAEAVLDSWVLDPQESNAIIRDVEQTRAALRQLYLTDYITQWDLYLNDVGIVPFTSLDEGARLTGILSGPDSPLRKFMQRAALETTLQNVKPGVLSASSVVAVVAVVAGKLDAYKKKLGEALGGAPPPPPAGFVANPVDAHFKSLHALVGPPPVPGSPPSAPAPLDGILTMLKDVAVYFDNADRAKRNGTTMPAVDVLLAIKRDAVDTPAPISAILRNIDSLGGGIASGSDRARLNAAWAISAAQFCRQAIAGRYPMVRNSVAEVLPEDFGRFFAPGGMLDDFFQKNLLQYVDMSGARWRWNEGTAGKLGIPADVLAEFERGARIRDTFFGSGGKLPSMRFELKPLSADPALSSVLLEIDGQPMSFTAGAAAVPVAFQLPSGKGAGAVRFQVTPASAQPEMKTEGPWAWLRMLDRALVEPSPQAERFRLTFNLSEREFMLELVASSVINPFRRDAMEQFHCPERL